MVYAVTKTMHSTVHVPLVHIVTTEKKAKLKDFYWKVAEEYFDRNIHCDTEEQAFYFKAGFVDACMELRNKEHLLKVNPPVKGITEISTNKDLWDRFMKENN